MTVIEVYADIWCPFAHVGLRTVLRRRRELAATDVPVRVRAWPLELVNGVPMDAGATERHVRELTEQVAPGMFAGFDAGKFPRTTLPALALANAAYRLDDATGEAVSLGLRDALFEEGRDISDPEVLAAIAGEYGVSPGPDDDAAVVAEWHGGQQRGVKGSPHFFCGGRDSFCPSLIIGRDDAGHVRIERNTRALDGFLEACFTAR